MRKLRRVILWIVGVLVVLVLALQMLGGYLAKSFLESGLSQQLSTEVRIGSVQVSLWRNRASVNKVKIANWEGFKKENFVEIPRIDMEVNFLSLLGKEVVIKRILLEKPKLIIEKMEDGKSNISRLKEALMTSRQEVSPVRPLEIKRLEIADGRLSILFHYDKYSTQSIPFDKIQMFLEDLQFPMQEGRASTLYFRSLVGEDERGTLKVKGKITLPHPKLSFDLDLRLKDLDLSQFNYYWYQGQPVKIRKGMVSLRSDAQCRENILEVKNTLSLREVSVPWEKLGGMLGMKEKVWKMIDTFLPFKEEVTADLDILVTGDIFNPKIHYSQP